MAEYRNPLQYGDQAFEWDPTAQVFSGGIQENAPGYLTELLGYRDRLRQGQTLPWEAEQYAAWEQAARAIPTRDIAALTAGWQGDLQGQWTENGWQAGAQDWWTQLDPGSPDAGPIMLAIRDKMDAGTATPQERALYGQTLAMAQDWNWRASVPQASDANPFGMGDQFMMALSALTAATGGAGAFGAFGAGAAGAGAASASPSVLGLPTSTLGTLSSAAGYGGQAATVLGGATGQDWVSQIGRALSTASGLAGGVAGLGNVASSGVTSLSDAARLAQSAGRITGALGRASGVEPLQQAAGYLGQAGQLGQVGSGVLPTSVTDWSTQRGSPMEWDYSNDWGASAPYDNWSWDAGSTTPSAWDTFTGWGGDERQTGWYQNADLDPTGSGSGGTGWLSSVLGGLGAAGKFLGSNASWLGPAVSTLGSLGAGAIGSNAAGTASAAQAQALNRGIDLQTAQWLQQQANQAPWMEAGRAALPELQRRAAQGVPAPFTAPNSPIWGQHAGYAPPSPTPGWAPQTYQGYTPGAVPQASQYGYQGPAAVQAGDYRWTPGQGPRAADYRYTPGQTPDAAQYQSGPPQLYQGAMPGTQVSTLTGQQVLDQDPGAAFRQSEARKALEASALSRGTGMSGSTLRALQSQSQDLASQEYGNAWQRMMARDTEQYGRNWGQYQQAWNQGVQGTQLGLQTNAQNFGQAMSAAQLREQVNQVASQQGWSQAQAEAAFREQMAQQASQQGYGQAMGAQAQQWQQGMAGQQFDWQRALQEAQQREQGQQFGWQANTQAQQLGQREQQQYETDLYNRMLQQSQERYGRDVYENQTTYDRAVQAYNSQNAQQTTDWNRWAGLAGYGPQAAQQLNTGGQTNATQMASLLSQLGTAQGVGDIGSALSWQRALGGATNNLTGTLAGLNA